MGQLGDRGAAGWGGCIAWGLCEVCDSAGKGQGELEAKSLTVIAEAVRVFRLSVCPSTYSVIS